VSDAPKGWTAEQWARLHPGFAADLAPALAAAEVNGLIVRPRSLDRSNAKQRALREAYLAAKRRRDAWQANGTGPEPPRPLPAAPPGANSGCRP
jgi:hypothetical protein